MECLPTGTNNSKKLKACINCTNAKTKCTPYGNLNNLCERCHRLNKNCSYAEATLRLKKNRSSARKQLEEKVDSLVSLLSTIQPGQHANKQAAGRNAVSPELTSVSIIRSPQPDSTLGGSVPSSSTVDEGSEVLESIPHDVQNELFSLYCREFAPRYPFVTFAVSETVETVRINRPMTLKALLAVSMFRDASPQRKASIEVVALIKQAMMTRATYSFDLLQAILVVVAYYQYQFRPKQQDLSLLIGFAITLIHELGIDKNATDKKSGMALPMMRPSYMEGQQYERWRALLGTYHAAAIFAQAFRKPRLMQYTKYMERCRQRLLDPIEMQTDFTIDILIGLHNIALEVNEIFTLYDVGSADVTGDLAIKSLVVGFMDRLKLIEQNTMSKRNAPLLSFEQALVSYVKLWIHEVAVHKDLWPTSNNSSEISATRITLGWAGLELAKVHLSHFVTDLNGEDFFYLDTGPWTQMLYSLIMLNKFVALDSTDINTAPTGPGQWDVQLAYREAEVQRLGDILVEKLAALVPEDTLYDGSRPIMWNLGFVVKNMVNGHKSWLNTVCVANATSFDPRVSLTPCEGGRADSSLSGTPSMVQGMPDVSTNFASAFPDITFDANTTAAWQDGMYQTFLWDTMMQDMTTLPFV